MAATTFYSDTLFQHMQYGPAAQLPTNPQDYPVGFRYFSTDSGERFVIQQDDTGPLPVRTWQSELALTGAVSINGTLQVTGNGDFGSITVQNTLDVTGTSTFGQLLTANGIKSTNNVSVTGNITATGLIEAFGGYRMSLGPFVQDSVPAAQVGVPLNIGSPFTAGNAHFVYVMERPGWLSALSVIFTDAATGAPVGIPAGGAAHITIAIGPPGLSPTPVAGTTITVGPGPTANILAFATFADNTLTFLAGSTIAVVISTDGGWTGTTLNATAKVVITG